MSQGVRQGFIDINHLPKIRLKLSYHSLCADKDSSVNSHVMLSVSHVDNVHKLLRDLGKVS